MSGLEMLPRVRADGRMSVIMITAYGDAETRRKATKKGDRPADKPNRFCLLRHEIGYTARAGRIPLPSLSSMTSPISSSGSAEVPQADTRRPRWRSSSP